MKNKRNRLFASLHRTLFLDLFLDRRTRPIFIYAVLIITVGAALFHWLEGWSWLDSVYFVVITLTTIGYGDFSPTTPATKLITSLPHFRACERDRTQIHDHGHAVLWCRADPVVTPEAPEFHDVMDKVNAAGFKTIAGCPSADATDTSLSATLKSLQLYLKKINERPDKYRIVRTVKDIDAAVAENKLGIYFTHQGSGLFEGDVEKVGVFRQLGYGFHTG